MSLTLFFLSSFALLPGVQVVAITSDFQCEENLELLHKTKATILTVDRQENQLMHVKLVLINEKVYFGSANFTDAAFFVNRLEALMLIDDEQQKLKVYAFVVFIIGLRFPDLIKSVMSEPRK